MTVDVDRFPFLSLVLLTDPFLRLPRCNDKTSVLQAPRAIYFSNIVYHLLPRRYRTVEARKKHTPMLKSIIFRYRQHKYYNWTTRTYTVLYRATWLTNAAFELHERNYFVRGHNRRLFSYETGEKLLLVGYTIIRKRSQQGTMVTRAQDNRLDDWGEADRSLARRIFWAAVAHQKLFRQLRFPSPARAVERLRLCHGAHRSECAERHGTVVQQQGREFPSGFSSAGTRTIDGERRTPRYGWDTFVAETRAWCSGRTRRE